MYKNAYSALKYISIRKYLNEATILIVVLILQFQDRRIIDNSNLRIFFFEVLVYLGTRFEVERSELLYKGLAFQQNS